MEGYAGASTCMMAASERQRYFQADLTSCGMMRSRAARSVGVGLAECRFSKRQLLSCSGLWTVLMATLVLTIVK